MTPEELTSQTRKRPSSREDPSRRTWKPEPESMALMAFQTLEELSEKVRPARLVRAMGLPSRRSW